MCSPYGLSTCTAKVWYIQVDFLIRRINSYALQHARQTTTTTFVWKMANVSTMTTSLTFSRLGSINLLSAEWFIYGEQICMLPGSQLQTVPNHIISHLLTPAIHQRTGNLALHWRPITYILHSWHSCFWKIIKHGVQRYHSTHWWPKGTFPWCHASWQCPYVTLLSTRDSSLVQEMCSNICWTGWAR